MFDFIPSYIIEYIPIVAFFAVAITLSMVIMTLPFILAKYNPDKEKESAYECGFEAFDDARSQFDVRFFLIAILFIIFDLEIVFLFPWAIVLKTIGWSGYIAMIVFLTVLLVALFYEWRKGGLEWK